jgi:hypothetical protein
MTEITEERISIKEIDLNLESLSSNAKCVAELLDKGNIIDTSNSTGVNPGE